MTKSDLELMLREAGALAHERDFFLFGQKQRKNCLPVGFRSTIEQFIR